MGAEREADGQPQEGSDPDRRLEVLAAEQDDARRYQQHAGLEVAVEPPVARRGHPQQEGRDAGSQDQTEQQQRQAHRRQVGQAQQQIPQARAQAGAGARNGSADDFLPARFAPAQFQAQAGPIDRAADALVAAIAAIAAAAVRTARARAGRGPTGMVGRQRPWAPVALHRRSGTIDRVVTLHQTSSTRRARPDDHRLPGQEDCPKGFARRDEKHIKRSLPSEGPPTRRFGAAAARMAGWRARGPAGNATRRAGPIAS